MKTNKFKKAGLLIGVMALSMIALAGCGKTKELNLADYVTVTFSGMEGEGTAYVDFDFAQMELDYADVTNDSPSGDQLQKMLSLEPFEMSISYDASKEEGLSNGDEVTVAISYSSSAADEAKVKVSGDSCAFTVTGLEEATVVDPFDSSVFGVPGGVNIYYSSYSPFLKPYIQADSTLPEPYSYISYTIDDSAYVANGDTVTVTAEISTPGYILEPAEKTITVEGQDQYVTKLDEMNASDLDTLLQMMEKDWGERLWIDYESSDGGVYGATNITTGAIAFDEDSILATDVELTPDEYITLLPFQSSYSKRLGSSGSEETEVYGYYILQNLAVDANGNITSDFDKYDIVLCNACYLTRDAMLADIEEEYLVVE